MNERQKLAGIELPEGVPAEENVRLQRAIGHAFVGGFQLVMLLSAALAVLSAISVWFMVSGKQQSRD